MQGKSFFFYEEGGQTHGAGRDVSICGDIQNPTGHNLMQFALVVSPWAERMIWEGSPFQHKWFCDSDGRETILDCLVKPTVNKVG